jgi:hypothetical protein
MGGSLSSRSAVGLRLTIISPGEPLFNPLEHKIYAASREIVLGCTL